MKLKKLWELNIWKIIFRFIAILPVFVVVFIVSIFVIGLLTSALMFIQNLFITEGMNFNRIFFKELFGPGISGALAMYLSLRVAPMFRKIIGIAFVLSISLAVILFNFITYVYYFDLGFNILTISSVAVLLGIGFVLYQYIENGDDFLFKI
ncbi:hypothetical protein L6270_01400 [Candidatus Parcubacteria bacterium]|nr:hypothetical protein [Patescibacteria group bacterium]MBU4309796.1 hypothetical protein [Patescibacteria group bacterium]MBU4431802.1 hypothetical protein [Patescibacteria group bacterium]MBU4578135.1 hypothetical protein [Patescibacteria group bacterium]MCG2696672.1 hypothetical protein [Candidatus Parcubacteria bacterium]